MQIFIYSRLIFRMVCELNEMYWQAPFAWEPAYHPNLGLESKDPSRFLIGLLAAVSVFSSDLHTAVGIIFLKRRPNCLFFNTLP